MPRLAKQPNFTSMSKPDYSIAAEMLAAVFHQSLVVRNTPQQEALCDKLSSTCGQAKTDMTYQ
jgi:hypothetical protein